MSDNQVIALLAGSAVFVVLMIAFYVVCIIGNWKIFTKAGQAGWKSIIPLYNTYVELKFTWRPEMFFVGLALGILMALGSVIANPVFAAISGVAGIGALVFEVIECNKLSKAFGHGAGFTVGLIFLAPIFRLILGFGDAQYVGNPSK